jgi:beta-lactamase superfamily II metal-dependent hydrolase
MAELQKNQLRVRMYHVGFGDSFLVSFPQEDGHKHVLIDNGVHPQGDLHNLDKVLGDIEAETSKQVELLIATHEHADHISGFGRNPQRWANLRVGEVWMPWTSNLKDPQAAVLRQKTARLAASLQARLTGARSPALYAVQNAVANAAALDTLLQKKFGGSPQVNFLRAGDAPATPTIAGLTARVLGPPSDPELLGQMDPPSSEHYFVDPSADAAPYLPFDESWKTKRPKGWPDSAGVREALRTNCEDLAFALDKAINNTSVVVLFSFGRERMLFAGDAQWGNWKGWIEDAAAQEILGQVTFYKVAHHGSVNATPVHAVNALPQNGFAAMVSTQSTPWPSIPRIPLVEALAKQAGGKLARSDQPDKAPAGFSKGDFWIDYAVEP